MAKIIKTPFILIAFILITGQNVYAAEITAKSCSLSDVRNAINSSGEGDVVRVPSGSCSWTSQMSISKGITLAGTGVTITLPSSNPQIRISLKSSQSFRLTGFTFLGAGASNGAIQVSGTSTEWRIDHNKFMEPKGRIFLIQGGSSNTYGVIDHNTATGSRVVPNIYVKGSGLNSWERDEGFGTANAVYVEDNVFDYSGAGRNEGSVSVDCEHGGKVVVRHNTFYNQNVTLHGTCSENAEPDAIGCYTFEIYNNTFVHEFPGSDQLWRAYYIRGGTGVIWGNNWVDTRNGGSGYKPSNWIDLVDERTCMSNPLCSSNGWDRCDGTSSWDNNDSDMGYICYGQPGAGQILSGRHTSSPIYHWGHKWNGSPITITAKAGVNGGGCSSPSFSDHIKSNRDFFNNKKMLEYDPFVYPHPRATQ